MKTAVEWLTERLINSGLELNSYDYDNFEQAKEMEKQQIIQAANSENSVDINYGERYYNETYNK